MDDREKVTAREINEVAIDLAQRPGFQLLSKGYAAMAADAATQEKGVTMIKKDSHLFGEIKQSRKATELLAVA